MDGLADGPEVAGVQADDPVAGVLAGGPVAVDVLEDLRGAVVIVVVAIEDAPRGHAVERTRGAGTRKSIHPDCMTTTRRNECDTRSGVFCCDTVMP